MKGKGFGAAVMIACLLTGCVRYDGSRIANESQLSMEYRVVTEATNRSYP